MDLQEAFAFLYRLSDDREWIEFVMQYQKEVIVMRTPPHCSVRLGQALFNCLPKSYWGRVTGKDFDPFYDDRNIPAFIDKLYELWSEQ